MSFGADQVVKVKRIVAGGRHNMVLCEDGSVFGFGYGAHGQLGTGYVKNIHTPTLIKRFAHTLTERVVQVELGSNHSLALTDTGSVYSAGSSKYG